MKKYILLLLTLGTFATLQRAHAQAAWIEPENPDVTQTVRLYCDLDKTTAATADAMKANPAGPYYIWTWKPTETERADTLQNGTGDKAWKNSNDRLVMTKDPSKGANVWYYEMVPTVFYNCDAGKVYSAGISFLVKPKDGGGYGDPDIKTEDLNITVAPPKLNRGLLYSVPTIMFENQITSLVYDNPLETKTTMQHAADGDLYMHMVATIEDTAAGTSSTVEPSKFFKVQENPKLRMKKMSDGRFRITMIPHRFFNVPDGSVVKSIAITVRKATYVNSDDQTNETGTIKAGCQ